MSTPPPMPVGLEYATVERVPPMRGGFRVMGGLTIGAGGLMALSGAGSVVLGVMRAMWSLPAPTTLPGMPQVTAAGQVGSGVVTIVTAGLAVWTGVALWRGRRWTRAVMLGLAQATLWLVAAFVPVMGLSVWRMSEVMERSGGTPAMPIPGMLAAVMWMSLAFAVGLYAAVPALVAWVMSKPGAEETVRMMDPRPSWVDGRPAAIAGFAVGFGVAGAFGLLAAAGGAIAALRSGSGEEWAAAGWAGFASVLALWVAREARRAGDAAGGERAWRAVCVYAAVTVVASVVFSVFFRGVLAAQAGMWAGAPTDETLLPSGPQMAAAQGWAAVVLGVGLWWFRPRFREFEVPEAVLAETGLDRPGRGAERGQGGAGSAVL